MFPHTRPLTRGVVVAIGILLAGAVAPAEAQRRLRPNRVDPAAVTAFERMSAYVAGLKAFELKTSYTFDIVAKNRQVISVDGVGHYLARRPDKLAAEVDNDLFARKYVYDGKTLTIASKGEKYYAQVAAPPTIRDMLAAAAANFAVEIPIADLFDLGTPHNPIGQTRFAFHVGTSVVDGIDADHWAFRGRSRDWQLWIRSGDKPVPLKFSLIDRRRPLQPRYSVTLSWIERTDIADTDFTFTPSAEQRRIEILRVDTAKGGN